MDSYVTKVRPGRPPVLQASADPQRLNSQVTEERVLCSTLLPVMFFFSLFLLYSSLHTQRSSSLSEFLQPWSNHISCAHACHQPQHQVPTGTHRLCWDEPRHSSGCSSPSLPTWPSRYTEPGTARGSGGDQRCQLGTCSSRTREKNSCFTTRI